MNSRQGRIFLRGQSSAHSKGKNWFDWGSDGKASAYNAGDLGSIPR